MTGLCETCKFWTEHQWRASPEECGLVGWNWCVLAENNYDKTTPHEESKAMAEDAGRISVAINTNKNHEHITSAPRRLGMA